MFRDPGVRIQDSDFGIQGFRIWGDRGEAGVRDGVVVDREPHLQRHVLRISGIGFSVSGIGYRISGPAFRVSRISGIPDVEFSISGIGCSVSGIGFLVGGSD